MIDIEEAQQMIDDCEERDSKLSDWDRKFIDSICHQLEKKGSLSDKQISTLEEIWDKVT